MIRVIVFLALVALVAFGGSGPVHAATMARMLEISRVIVPPSPGLFSAYGLLFAEHEHHAVQTFFRPFAELDLTELASRLDAMRAEALAELAADGYPPERTRLRWSADLRYVGQGFELLVPIDANTIHYEATLYDEEVFTQPWTVAWYAFARAPKDYVPIEYACFEGNDKNIMLMTNTDITGIRIDVP